MPLNKAVLLLVKAKGRQDGQVMTCSVRHPLLADVASIERKMVAKKGSTATDVAKKASDGTKNSFLAQRVTMVAFLGAFGLFCCYLFACFYVPTSSGDSLIPLSTTENDEIPQVLLHDGSSSASPLVEIGKINLEKLRLENLQGDESSPLFKILFASRQTYQKDHFDPILAVSVIENKTTLNEIINSDENLRQLYYLTLRELQVDVAYHAFLFEHGLSNADFSLDQAKVAIQLSKEAVVDVEFYEHQDHSVTFKRFYQSMITFLNQADFSGSNLGYNNLAKFYKSLHSLDADNAAIKVPLRATVDASVLARLSILDRCFPEATTGSPLLPCASDSDLYWLFMSKFEKYINSHFDELLQRDYLLHARSGIFEGYKFTFEDHLWPILFAAECLAKFMILSPFNEHNESIAISLMNFALIAGDYPPIAVSSLDKANIAKCLIDYCSKHDAMSLYSFVMRKVVDALKVSVENVKQIYDEYGAPANDTTKDPLL